MGTRNLSMLVLGCLCTVAAGQNVAFDIVPVADNDVTIMAGTPPVVTVEPGKAVPYEIVATVTNDPTNPAHAGLAGFDVDIVTDLAVAQPVPLAFDPVIRLLFTVGITLGTPSSDDVVHIAARQRTRDLIATGFALNQQAIIAEGRLVTPTFEDDFHINVTGTAEVFAITVGPNLVQAAGVMSPSQGFLIRARYPRPAATPPASLPAESIPTTKPPDDQVAGQTPSPPPTSQGLCGMGMNLALTATLLCLGAWKSAPPRS